MSAMMSIRYLSHRRPGLQVPDRAMCCAGIAGGWLCGSIFADGTTLGDGCCEQVQLGLQPDLVDDQGGGADRGDLFAPLSFRFSQTFLLGIRITDTYKRRKPLLREMTSDRPRSVSPGQEAYVKNDIRFSKNKHIPLYKISWQKKSLSRFFSGVPLIQHSSHRHFWTTG